MAARMSCGQLAVDNPSSAKRRSLLGFDVARKVDANARSGAIASRGSRIIALRAESFSRSEISVQV